MKDIITKWFVYLLFYLGCNTISLIISFFYLYFSKIINLSANMSAAPEVCFRISYYSVNAWHYFLGSSFVMDSLCLFGTRFVFSQHFKIGSIQVFAVPSTFNVFSENIKKNVVKTLILIEVCHNHGWDETIIRIYNEV